MSESSFMGAFIINSKPKMALPCVLFFHAVPMMVPRVVTGAPPPFLPTCWQVTLGGSVKSVTSIRQCAAGLEGLSADEVAMCLDAEAAVTIRGVSANSEAKHCKNDIKKSDSKSSFSSMFNDR